MRDLLLLPVAASGRAAEVDQMILIVHGVMLAALIVWGVFFVVPLVRYRKSKSPTADYRGLRSKLPYVLVLAMVAIESVLLVGFSLPFWEREVTTLPNGDVVDVRVVAQQFGWNIHYPGPDGRYGQSRPELVDEQANPLGLVPEDDAGKDDVVLWNQLHLPVGKTALIHLTSRDVVHGFSVPEFRVKQDAIPGIRVPVHFVPTMTSADFKQVTGNPDREFEIVCAQLCGLTHFSMKGLVYVETPEEFEAWLAKKTEERSQTDEWGL